MLTATPQPLWAPPLVVQVVPEGVSVGVPVIGSAPNAVISSPSRELTVEVAHDDHHVLSYGDFHVVAGLTQAGEQTAKLTVAQGSLATWIETSNPSVVVIPASTVTSATGAVSTSPTAPIDHVWIEPPGGKRWDLVTSVPVAWSFDGMRLTASSPLPVTLGLVAEPVGADAIWGDRAYITGLDPVIDTIAEWQILPGSVRQRLIYRRLRNGAGAVAVLPHQQVGLLRAEPLTGSFDSHLGTLKLQLTDTIEWSAPMSGALMGVPSVPLSDADSAAIATAIAATTQAAAAEGSVEPAGSYFGPKELGRLASTFDVARSTKSPVAASLQTELTERIDRWLMTSTLPDDRWIGYDPVWGGVSASSPEFGHEDYNDHHFQFGYLIQAAASIAEVDPEAAARWQPMIDLIAADLGMKCRDGFPRIRVVNAYLGHSAASGLAPFVDGINQESSSEAVHAWWALARWAVAVGDEALATSALAMYAMEAQTARAYWLGELTPRPTGYAHDIAGIVWGGKIDFATFFDARPASIVGIQLLPFTFGSLYRTSPSAAAARFEAGSAESGTHWQDLLAMDLAIADPTQAQQVIEQAAGSDEGLEEGVSEAFARYWVATLATLGPPDPTVTANPPYGTAFKSASGVTSYVAVNPTGAPIRVSFARDGNEVAVVDVPARSSATKTS
jgi:endo-1,3(4)-beta-glucanase